MTQSQLSNRDRFDRVGIMLSSLCALHCVLGIVLVTVLGLGGEVLFAPAIHEVGLAIAMLVGALSLGVGVYRHRNPGPIGIGAAGLVLMGAALAVGHGVSEAVFTIGGVALVAIAHLWNLRHAP